MEKKFICECGKEFKTLRSLGSHGGHCELYKPRVKKDSKYKNGNIYKCECGKEFSNSQSLNAHLSHCDIHHQSCGTERKVRKYEIEHKMNGWDNKTEEEKSQYVLKQVESFHRHMENDDEFANKIHIGHSQTDESKRKIGEGRRRAIIEGRGNKWIPPHIQSSYAEQYFIDLFNKHNIKFKNNLSVYPYFLDFAWENEKVYIEIDGEQHYTEPGLKKDNERTQYLESKGWKLLKRIRWSEFSKLKDIERKEYISKLFEMLNFAQMAK